MDPFRIVCPACSTKLVVRQPELVGRTVPCPKCKNAIHVVRAGQVAWNPGTVAAGDLSSSESSEPIHRPKLPKSLLRASTPKRLPKPIQETGISRPSNRRWPSKMHPRAILPRAASFETAVPTRLQVAKKKPNPSQSNPWIPPQAPSVRPTSRRPLGRAHKPKRAANS